MTREPDFVDECYKDSDLNLLKKLTLIIPTYNRNFYLSRCLWYHAHFPFGQIIVADSSPEDKKIINKDTVAEIRTNFERDIIYLEYPPESETYGGDIYRKWGDAVQHTTTEFSQICTDKSFVIPTVCCNSIMFLKDKLDYVSSFAGGATFLKLKSKQHYVPDTAIIPYTSQNSLERIRQYAKSEILIDNLFPIYRSNIHKMIYNNLIKYEINDIRFGEVALALQPFLIGKINISSEIGRIVDRAQSRSGILKLFNTNESSTYRYPNLQEYPKKLREIRIEKLLQCLLSLSPNYPSIDEEKTIREATIKIIRWWMCSVNNDTLINRYIDAIWDTLPYKMKYQLSKKLKIGSYLYKIPIDDKKEELSIISKIITENLTEQSVDKVISYLI